jgi:hypothetical protein
VKKSLGVQHKDMKKTKINTVCFFLIESHFQKAFLVEIMIFLSEK